jgi:hypothetical protein
LDQFNIRNFNGKEENNAMINNSYCGLNERCRLFGTEYKGTLASTKKPPQSLRLLGNRWKDSLNYQLETDMEYLIQRRVLIDQTVEFVSLRQDLLQYYGCSRIVNVRRFEVTGGGVHIFLGLVINCFGRSLDVPSLAFS